MIINIIIGLLCGIISGLGIGGGTLLIPMLVFFRGINQTSAQNINLLYFIPTAIISVITHKKNNNIEYKVLKGLIIFGLLGASGGSILCSRLDDAILRKMFGGFLFVMGIREFFVKEEKTAHQT